MNSLNIHITGLTFESHRDIQIRLFSKLEHDKDITIQALTARMQQYLSKKDTMFV